MADWAVCYPEKVPECPPGDDSDADVEGEFGEEGRLSSGQRYAIFMVIELYGLRKVIWGDTYESECEFVI
jgi:hypothetical protein